MLNPYDYLIMKINVNRIIVKAANESIIAHQIITIVQCKLCFNILIDPYDCQCCLHTFCYNCIKAYIKSNNHCPFTEFFSNNPFPKSPLKLLKKSSSNITQLIAGLKFQCKNKSNGCNTELTICNLTEHEKKCSINQSNSTTLQHKNKLIETPCLSYKLKGKDMSFRNVDNANDNENDCLEILHSYTNNKSELNQKIDKIYDMLNDFIYHNRHYEETPKFDKCSNHLLFSVSSPSAFSPIDPQLSNRSNNSNETLYNIANELTVLNEKITSIESKMTPFSSTASSASSKTKTGKGSNEIEKAVSMFDSSSFSNISIGKNSININTTPVAIDSNHSTKQIMNLKQQVVKSKRIQPKKPQTESSTKRLMSSSSNINILLNNKDNKKSSLGTINENIYKRGNNNQYQLIKEELIAFIEQCNKELKQYIFELILDNSNLFVQKIDEVLDKIDSKSIST